MAKAITELATGQVRLGAAVEQLADGQRELGCRDRCSWALLWSSSRMVSG